LRRVWNCGIERVSPWVSCNAEDSTARDFTKPLVYGGFVESAAVNPRKLHETFGHLPYPAQLTFMDRLLTIWTEGRCWTSHDAPIPGV
jgi:hypothetical protein